MVGVTVGVVVFVGVLVGVTLFVGVLVGVGVGVTGVDVFVGVGVGVDAGTPLNVNVIDEPEINGVAADETNWPEFAALNAMKLFGE